MTISTAKMNLQHTLFNLFKFSQNSYSLLQNAFITHNIDCSLT